VGTIVENGLVAFLQA